MILRGAAKYDDKTSTNLLSTRQMADDSPDRQGAVYLKFLPSQLPPSRETSVTDLKGIASFATSNRKAMCRDPRSTWRKEAIVKSIRSLHLTTQSCQGSSFILACWRPDPPVLYFCIHLMRFQMASARNRLELIRGLVWDGNPGVRRSLAHRSYRTFLRPAFIILKTTKWFAPL
jgi:hypothetical protein